MDKDRRAVLARFGKSAALAPAMVVLLTAQSSEVWATSGFTNGQGRTASKKINTPKGVAKGWTEVRKK